MNHFVSKAGEQSPTADLFGVTPILQIMASRTAYFGYARRHIRGLRLMTNLGWFAWGSLEASIGNVLWLEHTQNSLGTEQIDAYLQARVHADSDNIVLDCMEAWPQRQRHLACLKSLLDSANWLAFIPLALAQADGMSNELFGKHQLFHGSHRKRRRALRIWRKQAMPDAQILFYGAQYYVEAKWHRPVAGPTRADVLHGLTLDYDNEKTAMQSLSLLGYMAFLKSIAELPRGPAKD